MNHAKLNEMLTGRNAQRRKLANNTYAERRDGGAIAVKLHATDILTFSPDGTVIANTGGWRTHTTKDRLNEYGPCRIWQERGKWYLTSGEIRIEFADGITWHPDGRITGAATPEASQAEKLLRKRIADYCKALVSALPLPMPGNGDCWYCVMREEKTGKPLGEVTQDTSHLESHLDEKYFVPALVWNALLYCGCNPQGGGCAWFEVAFGNLKLKLNPGQVGRFVRKYLHRQFGLV